MNVHGRGEEMMLGFRKDNPVEIPRWPSGRTVSRRMATMVLLGSLFGCASSRESTEQVRREPDHPPRIESSSLWQTVVQPAIAAREVDADNGVSQVYELVLRVDWPDQTAGDRCPEFKDRAYRFRMTSGCTARLKQDFSVSYIKDYRVEISNDVIFAVPIVELEEFGVEAALTLGSVVPEVTGEVVVKSLSDIRAFRTSLRVGTTVVLDVVETSRGEWNGRQTYVRRRRPAAMPTTELIRLDDGARVSLELLLVTSE